MLTNKSINLQPLNCARCKGRERKNDNNYECRIPLFDKLTIVLRMNKSAAQRRGKKNRKTKSQSHLSHQLHSQSFHKFWWICIRDQTCSGSSSSSSITLHRASCTMLVINNWSYTIFYVYFKFVFISHLIRKACYYYYYLCAHCSLPHLMRCCDRRYRLKHATTNHHSHACARLFACCCICAIYLMWTERYTAESWTWRCAHVNDRYFPCRAK